MIGRTPGNIVAIRPLRDGVIADFDVAHTMIKSLIEKAASKSAFKAPRIIVCYPSGVTEVEKRAVTDAARSAGAKDALLIEEPLAAAIGAGLDITIPDGSMIVDIGGGTCDVAVISLGGIVARKSIKVAGDKFDEAIIKYIKSKYKIMIGEKTAEHIKVEIGSAYNCGEEKVTNIKGRNLVTGLPDEITINSEEIREALKETVNLIVEAVKVVLEKTPPELASDIVEKGILMTGGGALLSGLDKLIESETGVTVNIAENSVEAVAEGTGSVLGYIDKLDKDINSREVILIE